MKYSLLIALVTAFIFVSCQKEIDWGTGGGSGGGDRLIKIFSKTNGSSDSTVITYAYDASGRLINETTVGVGSGQTLDMTFDIKRNSSGIITTTVQKSAVLQAQGIDSVVTRYYYNSGTSRYTARAFDLSIGGFSVTDSAIFTYDGSGRITAETHWLASGIIPAFMALKNNYTYSSNGQNLTGVDMQAATNPGDPLSTIATQAYTYDTKTDALIVKNEAIVLGRIGFYNSNNATKVDFVDANDPSNNFTQDFVYRYNASNRPDSSYRTDTPGGTVTAAKYYYQ